MAMNVTGVSFGQVKVGQTFICRSHGDFEDRTFVKIVRPNSKYAAIPLEDYKQITSDPFKFMTGDYTLVTDCSRWYCEPELIDKPSSAPRKTTEKALFVSIYDDDLDETIATLKVTPKQREILYYIFKDKECNFPSISERYYLIENDTVVDFT